jgi:hypothetical protein
MRALVPLLLAAPLQALALEVDCEPAHPFFCLNIHAGCAGRTEVPTVPFKLKADGERGWIVSASGEEHARAERGSDDTRVILWPHGRRGYIRLMTDGRYSFRHYVGDTGIMSYGECR